MKVRVNEISRSKTNIFTGDVLSDKLYDVISVEPFINGNWYRIVDESGEDYLYPPSLFDIVEE